MFGVSGFELLIIVVFVLIIFGPDKLPELGRTVGKAMGMFKRAQDDMERMLRVEMMESERKQTAEKAAAKAKAQLDEVKAAQSDDESAGELVEPVPVDPTAAAIWAATEEDDEEEDEE